MSYVLHESEGAGGGDTRGRYWGLGTQLCCSIFGVKSTILVRLIRFINWICDKIRQALFVKATPNEMI